MLSPELSDTPFEDETTVLKDAHPIGDPLCEVHLVSRDQNEPSLVAEPPNHLLDHADASWIERGDGLVHDEVARTECWGTYPTDRLTS